MNNLEGTIARHEELNEIDSCCCRLKEAETVYEKKRTHRFLRLREINACA
ncbi:hypothetical protein [Paenibacillus sp. FSL H7-0331]|nr:hypothetical protein [Paenibacillus sp. FSL H7-0331]